MYNLRLYLDHATTAAAHSENPEPLINKRRSMADVTYPCYIQRKDASGNWYWIYYARNGEEIARSSESYKSRNDCERSIELIKNSKDHPVYYYN
ncbi:YegP family protein [Microvirga sp. GCM10011540]|uniref:YegP family protein n=1 Tax=Microvirga sp. GCM10011540 TaxID=3317338 RepID=UPI0036158D8D